MEIKDGKRRGHVPAQGGELSADQGRVVGSHGEHCCASASWFELGQVGYGHGGAFTGEFQQSVSMDEFACFPGKAEGCWDAGTSSVPARGLLDASAAVVQGVPGQADILPSHLESEHIEPADSDTTAKSFACDFRLCRSRTILGNLK